MSEPEIRPPGSSSAGGRPPGPHFTPPRSHATRAPQPSAQPRGDEDAAYRHITPDDCPHCHTPLVNPTLAIVCQNCQKFVVKLRVWHGALAVLATLAAIVLQALHADSVNQLIARPPVVVGLLTAQMLLVVAVRSLERRLLLIIVSLALVPASLLIVALVLDVPASPVYRTSATWIGALCFLGLAIQLFFHWHEAGRQYQLSLWRILGTFSVIVSAGALLVVAALKFLPEGFIPANDILWPYVHHLLNFRAGMIALWFAWVVILALPPAFGRNIAITPDHNHIVFVTWILYVVSLIRRVLNNVGRELADSFAQMIALARVALGPVVRRFLFLLSAGSLQIAVCLAVDGYLRYMVDREVHWLQAGITALLAAFAPLGFFWSATRLSIAEVLHHSFHTVTMVGMLFFFIAAIASWLWGVFELNWGRAIGPNWFAILSGISLLIVFAEALARRDERDKPARSV